MDKDTRLSIGYDYYGMLLSSRQREIMNLYHEENLSLAEIGEELSLSRQAVHDALKNAQNSIAKYEDKLGLVNRFEKTGDAINEIDKIIDELIKEGNGDPKTKNRLLQIKKIIDQID